MRKLSAVLLLTVVLGACQATDDGGEHALGGVGSVGGGDDGHCSGLLDGAHCGPPNSSGGTTIEPGEFLPPTPCDPTAVPPAPAAFVCLALGMQCLAQPPPAPAGSGLCGVPGLADGPGGLVMTPGAPPATDESALWVGLDSMHVVKVNTRGAPNPLITGKYNAYSPMCVHTSYGMGFSGRTNGTSGQIEISNWTLDGYSIDQGVVGGPLNPVNLADRAKTYRNKGADIIGSSLYLANGANVNSNAYLHSPQPAYHGFHTRFTYRASSTGVEGFAFNAQNDGNTARAVLGEDGYKSDLSISFDRLNNDGGAPAFNGMVEVFYLGNSLGRFGTTALQNNNFLSHAVEIFYHVPLPYNPAAPNGALGGGQGWVYVLIDGVWVVPGVYVNMASRLVNTTTGALNMASQQDSCQLYFGGPSRTAIDGNDDSYVGIRWGQAAVTKFAGSAEAARCTRDYNGNGFSLADTSTSTALGPGIPGAPGLLDECVLYTVPVAGNRLVNGGDYIVRALTVGGSDADSGPRGSLWAGTWFSPFAGRGGASKLRNSDGYELAYFNLDINPYGAAGTQDGRIWYTTGHGGQSLQYVDARRFDLALTGTPLGPAPAGGCEGQGCVGPVFTLPAAGAANLTVKRGGYCRSEFYGMNVDEWDNVWNAVYSCSGVARFTPPGNQRIDQAPGVFAGAQGHWDYYQLEHGTTGVFITASKPMIPDDPGTAANEFRAAAPATMFAGRDQVTQLDAITMNPGGVGRIRYTGVSGGHGGLSFDVDNYLWRVGGTTISRFLPYGIAPGPIGENRAPGYSGGITTRFDIPATSSTYTYSDFTGYTRANITARQVSYDRLFTSTCGDNARKVWTRLKWTGDVPDGTQLEFRVVTAQTVAQAMTKIQGGASDAGPFYYTPNVKVLSSTAPANLNESGIWLPSVLAPADRVSEFIGVRVEFTSEDFSITPSLASLEIEGVCEGLPVPACTSGAPTCAGYNCGQLSDGCSAAGRLSCGAACGGADTCGGAAPANVIPNNVCGL